MSATHRNYILTALALCLMTLDGCQPIMVEFGTSKVIPPKEPVAKDSTLQPRSLVPRNPAPVNEVQEEQDLPNPNTYRPPVPHQYRTKLYSLKPNPNLLLGTALDQRYTPSLQKYVLHKKQYSRNLGPDYTGPHVFEKQDYEQEARQKTTLQPSVQYDRDQRLKADQKQKYVPQIGIVYSGGVKYYVPQMVYVNNAYGEGEDENSVYDKNDNKYFYYNRQ